MKATRTFRVLPVVVGGAAGALVVLVVWVAVRPAPAEFDEQTLASIEAHRLRAGISLDAAMEIARQDVATEHAVRGMSDGAIRIELARFEQFTGRDRVEVARWTSALLVDLTANLAPAQVEMVREPLRAMILEFWDQPQFSWELFTVARNLGLHTDPLIDEFAREAIASESIPAQTRGFIRRVMFETPDREER